MLSATTIFAISPKMDIMKEVEHQRRQRGKIEVELQNVRQQLRDVPRVLISDRSPVTAGLRYRYTGAVWPVTGRNRWNSNLNSNFAVQPVRPVYRPVWRVTDQIQIFFFFGLNSNARKIY